MGFKANYIHQHQMDISRHLHNFILQLNINLRIKPCNKEYARNKSASNAGKH